ncbi:unnamed protein product [Durusdinium trenchii]|uniref:Uncharacterized protein n=1 Tax=Durusdinium trenchii TaxID=1381693 RepID=A0ABP0RY43_9DINO
MLGGRGLTWPVEPSHRVGSFCLGMGVNEALSIVQKMGSLDRAEFSFDDQRPFDVDLTLRLPSWGLQLCFDSYQQDLRLISVRLQEDEVEQLEARALAPELIYSGQKFNSLGLRDIYQIFGPTWIGDFRVGDSPAYVLRYPGLAFEFPLPEDMVDALAAKEEHPMDIAGSPSLLWVFAAQASVQSPSSVVPELLEAVGVLPGVGVQLQGRKLRFGAMPQDVVSDFGPPQQVCIKDVDAFRIHSTRTPAKSPDVDYYYNYFYLGLDALFDGETHSLQKIVLHVNPPTHERFSRYTRCFFELLLDKKGEAEGASAGDVLLGEVCEESEPDDLESHPDTIEKETVDSTERPDAVRIDVRWQWADIEEALCRVGGLAKSKPLVMDQEGYTSFGSTYFYGFPGLVFEVMQNGYLASLTVFRVHSSKLPSIFQRR